MPALKSLPPYVECTTMGESSVLPPGRFEGVTSYAFAVRAQTESLRALVQRHLAAPTGGAWEVDVLGPVVLLVFNYARRLTAPNSHPGWTENHEATLTIPVVLRRPGLFHLPRIATWLPYIWIGNSRGMCTGRESWGYGKAIGDIPIPPIPAQATAWSVDTVVFPEFTPDTQGTRQTLLDLRRVDPPAPGDHPSLWTEAGAFGLWLLEQAATHPLRDLELAFDALHDWAHGTMPVVNLKQFRDAVDGTRACYQGLVLSPLQVRGLRAGGPLSGQYDLRLLPCASHPIASQLGIESRPDGTIPVLGGAFVEWDFDAAPGEVLWEAPRS